MRLEEEREEGCENEAVEQVCFADKIFLNKIDLCDRKTLDTAKAKIRKHNRTAAIEEVQFTDEANPLSKMLDLDMFSIKRALEVNDEILEDKDVAAHKHDSRIGTFSYRMPAEMTMDSMNEFLSAVLQEKGPNIYRMKGFIAIKDCPDKFVFHSVGMLFTCKPYIEWK